MENNNPIPCPPTELAVTGLVLGFQNDSITYTSKQTGKKETLNRDVVILKCSFGILVCRFFNPSLDVKSVLKEGQKVSFPLASYGIEGGLKVATVRI